jgi:hypothetical protein
MKNAALVLSGIAIGVVAATLLVPRVFAQAPRAAPPPRWQQFCEPVASIAEASSSAAARGAEGWELVMFSGGALCFKRPAPPKGSDEAWPGY